MSNLINKAKDALSGNKHDSTGTSTHPQHDNVHSTNAGPHSSNIANKVDPRVDSDRDNRNNPASHTGGLGNTQDTYSTGGTTGGLGHSGHGTTGTTGGLGHTGHGTTGTTGGLGHSGHGTTGTTGGLGHSGHGTTSTTGGLGSTGVGGTSGTQYDNPRSTNEGPHSSNLANKLDPRVDSDRDGRNDPTSRTGGYGQTQTGTTGGAFGGVGSTGATGHGQSTNAGPHSSNLANKLDPRVDSDRDGHSGTTGHTGGGLGHTQGSHGTHGVGSHGTHGTTGLSSTGGAGYGSTTTGTTGAHTGIGGAGGAGGAYDDPRSTNAGPHSSNLANKADPRVDSDRDGRGLGHSQGTTTTGGAHGTSAGSGTTTSSGLPSSQQHAHDSSLLNRLDPRVKTDSQGNPNH